MADLTRSSKNPRAARVSLTKCQLASSPRCVSSCCRPAGRRRRCASPASRCASNAARTGSARNRPRPPHPRPTRPPRHPPAVSGPLEDLVAHLPGYGAPPAPQYSGFLDASAAEPGTKLHYWFAQAEVPDAATSAHRALAQRWPRLQLHPRLPARERTAPHQSHRRTHA